jgi:hypothetical protein
MSDIKLWIHNLTLVIVIAIANLVSHTVLLLVASFHF